MAPAMVGAPKAKKFRVRVRRPATDCQGVARGTAWMDPNYWPAKVVMPMRERVLQPPKASQRLVLIMF